MALAARWLGVSESEWARAWPLFTYLFLVTAGQVVSKATRDALFLAQFDATALPYADVAIAVLVGLTVSAYLRAHRRWPLRALHVASVLFLASNALAFWWLSLSLGQDRVLFTGIYLWVGVLGALAPMQVWTLANFVLTTREAKRTFGFIGSGAILGWILGGLATRLTAATLGTEALLLWVAGSLVVSAGLANLAWRRAAALPAVASASDGLGLRESAKLVAASPYARAIAAVILLASFTTTVAGWQFKAIAKAAIPATDELTAYFGLFNVLAGAGSLVLQVTLTNRVLRTAGVGLALFIVPVAMGSSAVMVLFAGSLLAASALKASDQVLRYSIDKATVELLYLPLSAADTFRVKSLIDSVVYRMGDGLGGLAVLAFATALGWTPVQVTWITLAGVAAWLAASAAARTRYVRTLEDSIHQHRLDAERTRGALRDRSAAAAVARKLQGSPEEILYALAFFEDADPAGATTVRDLLSHPSAEVRLRAVSVLSQTSMPEAGADIEALLADPDLEVRTEALLYLARHTSADPLSLVERVGDFRAFSIQASMVAFLARPGRTQNVEAATLMLQRMVGESGDQGLRVRVEAAKVIAVSPDLFERELRKLLEDDAPEVAREAIRAAGRLGKRALVHRLVDRLGEPTLTDDVVAALARFGDRIVGTMRDYLIDPDTPPAIRRELPGVLQAIGSRAAHVVLVESLLDGDPDLRLRVISALNKLAQLHPGRPVDREIVETALAAELIGHYRSYQVIGRLGQALASQDSVNDVLRDGLARETERIFRLMKILYPEHDLHSAFVGIQSADITVHDNALEFLDQVLPVPLRALVAPLFDREVSVAERAAIADRLVGVSLDTSDEAVDVLSQSDDTWLQACAAFAIGELKLVRLAPKIDRWMTSPDPLLRSAAAAARDKLKANAAMPSVDVG